MPTKKPLISSLRNLMIQEVPAYANKFYYSLGFLSMISFVLLLATGLVMVFYGPDWWLTDSVGKYVRSVHLWATQAFVLFILLHLMVVFFTSGFRKPRRTTWVLGSLMFLFVIAEAEFGYVLRDDFSSQWRALQGADFYNGSGLGWWINSLNYRQIYGIHVVLIPAIIIGLLFMHYLLVRVLGIAKPYRKDKIAATVKADHGKLFARGGVLAILILILAVIFPSPFLKPTTTKEIAQNDPKLMGQTLVKEFDHSSDTAGYMDSIQPYKFDTRAVFVEQPYAQLAALQSSPNFLTKYNSEPASLQASQLSAARDYFDNTYPHIDKTANPLITAVGSLIDMGSAGFYQPALNAANPEGAYATRFLADTGVLDDRAQALNITTEQYGMLREEQGRIPPGAWWLAPIGLLNHTVLSNDENGDRDGAAILGGLLLLLVAFPFIPGLNKLPDKLKIYKLIWR